MKKKISIFTLAFVMILSSLSMTLGANEMDNEGENAISAEENVGDGTVFIGYQDGDAIISRKLYVEKADDSTDRRIVYCFNKLLHWPDTKDQVEELRYTKTTGSVKDFKDKVNKISEYKGQELIDKLKVVLLNGYPNGNKIQNALGLSNDQMQGATQMAVWHFTDNGFKKIGQFNSASDTEALAVALLIDMAGAEKTLDKDVLAHFETIYKKEHPEYQRPEAIEMPANSTLDLYISNGIEQADGKGYQNLLGAFLINKETKEIIEINNDEPSKDMKKVGLVKYGSEQKLAGAEFEITNVEDASIPVKTVTSLLEGAAEFELEVGSYVLNETKAPAGFQKLTGVKFTVNADGTITIDDIG